MKFSSSQGKEGLGIITWQDHGYKDAGRPLDLRDCVLGVRVKKRHWSGLGMGGYEIDQDVGPYDVNGMAIWRKGDKPVIKKLPGGRGFKVIPPREISGGAFAWPSRMIGNKTAKPIIYDDEEKKFVEDERYLEEKVNVATDAKMAGGLTGITLAASNEDRQELLFFPADNRLVAVNFGEPPDTASEVADVDGRGNIAPDRQARLQSAFRVIKEPDSQTVLGLAHPRRFVPQTRIGPPPSRNVIGWNIDQTGQKDTLGGFVYGQDQAGDEVVGVVSQHFGGPFHLGIASGDKHDVGYDDDGTRINATKLSTNALFVDPRFPETRDAPILFEDEIYRVIHPPSPYKTRVHMVYDPRPLHPFPGSDKPGYWRAYAEAFFYRPRHKNPPPPPPVPLPDVFHENKHNNKEDTVKKIHKCEYSGDGPPPQDDIQATNACTGFGSIVFRPQEVRDGVPDLRQAGNQENIDNDGNRISAAIDDQIDSGANDPGFQTQAEVRVDVEAPRGDVKLPKQPTPPGGPGTYQDIAQNFRSQLFLEKIDRTVPTTARMEAFGNQGLGSSPGEWSYNQKPGESRYPGGTSAGGVMVMPPENDISCLPDMSDGTCEAGSDTTFLIGPGVRLGFGTPDLETGLMASGFTQGRTSSGTLGIFTHQDQVMTLYPNRVDDVCSYTDEANPDTNYSGATSAVVENDGAGSDKYGWLSFLGIDSIKSTSAFISADLYLYSDTGTATNTTALIHDGDAASENLLLTWNNQPGVVGLVVSGTISTTANTENIFDVTTWFGDVLSGAAVNLLRVSKKTTEAGKTLKYFTTNYVTDKTKWPKLVVTWAGGCNQVFYINPTTAEWGFKGQSDFWTNFCAESTDDTRELCLPDNDGKLLTDSEPFNIYTGLDESTLSELTLFPGMNHKITSSSGTTISGIPEPLNDGVRKRIFVSGTSTVTFANEDTTTSAVNRFKMTGSADVDVDPGGMIEFTYQQAVSRWVQSSVNTATDLLTDTTGNGTTIVLQDTPTIITPTVSGTLTANAGLDVGGDLSVSGTASVSGAATFGSTLDVAGGLSVSGTASVSGAATLGSTLSVTGGATLSSTLDVTGAATLSSTLDVVGDLSVSGTASVSGAVALGSTLDVTGDFAVSGTASVSGATALGSTLDVAGFTTMSASGALVGTLAITGDEGDVVSYNRGDDAVRFAMGYTGATTDLYLGSTTSHRVRIITGGNDRIAVTALGDVGIGNIAPAYLLEMESSGGGYYSDVTHQWTNGSTRAIKTDIDQERFEFLKILDGITVRSYRYYSEKDKVKRENIEKGTAHEAPYHPGIIADEAPEILTGRDRNGLATGDAIGFLLGVVKELHERIRILETAP